MATPINIAGQTFGRLTALYYTRKSRHGNRIWLCNCTCGTAVEVVAASLKKGETKSCGCLQKDTASKTFTKHGMSSSPEYKSWNAMKGRCYDSNHPKYKNYGGRGIIICERWLNSFENFYLDMGKRPKGTTIDRKDSDGNYEPNNCRWATLSTQSHNRKLSSNSTTGVRGVSLDASDGKYKAYLSVDKTTVLNKKFSTFEDAVDARLKAEEKYLL